MNAADFGNYNAGYTGTHAGIPKGLQLIGAGVVEMLKNRDYKEMIIQSQQPRAPYGDRPMDYMMNNLWMGIAEQEISKE